MSTAFEQHPTVAVMRQKSAQASSDSDSATALAAAELRELCLAAGADDVGFVALARPELDDQRAEIVRAFPATKTLLSFVVKMNREPVRNVNRSVSNLEFHHTTDVVNEVAREIVRQLEDRGIRAVNPPSGFPMEMSNFPGKIWVVSHKPVAVAAGLGQMGVHRNVIHPKFGNFIILGTILLDTAVDRESQPIEYNPCLSCKLCVAVCPVGAIKTDGQFDPSACLTHNYREFMGGFTEWVKTIAESDSGLDYNRRVTDQETASMWQSLSFGPNYKAAYCLAVCPAGEDVIGPFLTHRPEFLAETLKPLQQKHETIYVVPESDAEEYVARKFPHKKAQRVAGVRPASVRGFINGMKIVFQAGRSVGLDAVYHFTFTGAETPQATVTIRNQQLDVQEGLHGTPDCAVTADAATWLGFLRKERSIVWAIVRRKVRVKGKLSLLTAFGKCFPS